MTAHDAASLTRGGAPPGLSRLTGEIPALTVACRALLVLFGVGLSVGLGIGFILLKDPLTSYLAQNEMRPAIRRVVLGIGFGTALFLELVALVRAFSLRANRPFVITLRQTAHRLAPLGVVGFLPLMFQWQAWRGKDAEFLSLVALAAVCFETGMRVRLGTEPLTAEAFVAARIARFASNIAARFPRAVARAPLTVVCTGAIAYAVYFSYVTIAWHYSVRSGYDLALENNLLWNLLHGGQFFKASPFNGPVGSHFGHGATFFAFALAPFYALYQRPETLCVIQSVLLGGAAIPLFLYARLYLGAGAACVLSLAYLMCPAVHGVNLYEFHYLPLSTFFLWLALYGLESRRDVLATASVVFALSICEDVAVPVAIWGLYLLITGKRPRAGAIVAGIAALYFVVLKIVIMPRFPGSETSVALYQKLLPAGETGLGAVAKTVVGNPWYTIGTLLEEDKLYYVMQMYVPLALIPLRRPLALLFALPGLWFTLLATGYVPATSIHYQHNAHWITPLFVATVLVIASFGRIARRSALCAVALTMFACSYQYGAVLQRNTSAGGPIPYKFGVDREGRHRHAALESILRDLPPRAKISCSAFTTPQVSSRPDAYSMTLGIYDAEYIVFPTTRAEFVGNEFDTIVKLLQSKAFGVVATQHPFALARRGQDTARNADLLATIR